MTHSDAGRLGGLQTVRRHGSQHMSEINRMRKTHGGRPRLLSLTEIVEQQPVPENKFEGGKLPTTFTELKELVANKYGGRLANSPPDY